MSRQIVIEVCVDNVESAIAAKKGGADRVELCSALSVGGLTPSKGLIEYVISHVNIPVFVLIRPRSGDFLYSKAEFDVIKSDIFSAKVAGASGIVIGMLNSDGSVDTCRMKEVIEMCDPLPVTFHRAFDMSKDLFDSMEKIIDLGCNRILTSGGNISASLGGKIITRLNEKALDRIIIMPGAGINSKVLPELIELTGCKEYHLSGAIISNGKMKYSNTILADIFPSTHQITDSSVIKEVVEIAESFTT